MNKGRIGVQLSTIRPKLETLGVYACMERLYELGYTCVEISQVAMNEANTAAFIRAQKDFGIKVAAMNAVISAPTGECLARDYTKILHDCALLDCSILRIGGGPFDRLTNRENVLTYCDELNLYADKLKKDGIDYYYHNHAAEFCKFDGEYILDILKNNSHINFELDIHWIQAGGEKPEKIIRQYAGRIRLLHLKDYRVVPVKFEAATPGTKPHPMLAGVQFAEVGEGNLDIRGCIEAGLAAGSVYFLIEQDSTYGRDAFDSLKISHDNLVSLGYGDWFHA